MASDATKKSRSDKAAEEEPTPGLAGLWAKHGNKVLIALTVALLVFWAVRYRQKQEVERQNVARDNLAGAWVALDQLRLFASQPRSPEIDQQVSTAESQINQTVQTVLDDPKVDGKQAAWAWLARGEVFWTLAQRPKSISPTTAPTSAPASQPATEPLALARNAYEQVINNFPSDPTALTIARFGLAAVAEDKRDFATAREQYKKLIETPNFTNPQVGEEDAAKQQVSMAQKRLDRLAALEKPTLLLPATQPVASNSTLVPELMLGGASGPQLPAVLPSAIAPSAAPSSTRPATTQP